MQDIELSLATRAAWLSYVGGLTQEEIAARLGVSRVKVTRLIAAAQRAGLIRVFIEGGVAECVEFEDRLKRRYGLRFVTVVPDLGEAGLPLRSLASAGAHYLCRVLESDPPEVIAVGHGRTLAAVAQELPRVPSNGTRFVSLLGSLTRQASANPFDVIHRLVAVTGGEGYFMPAPFFADSLEDREVLMAQRSLRQVMDLAAKATLCLVGIGELGPEAHLRETGMVTPAEYAELEASGAVGELLGQFIDRFGNPVDAEVCRRAVAMPLQALAGKEVVAIAGGPAKAAAIDAVLRGRVITGLITDESTARRLAAVREPGHGPVRTPARAKVA